MEILHKWNTSQEAPSFQTLLRGVKTHTFMEKEKVNLRPDAEWKCY